jgi:tetratricopeptide (TPR) repeat protein
MDVIGIKGTKNVVHDSTINAIGEIVILPTKPAEHLPETWKVPPRNHNFVGRDGLLGKIKEHLNGESTTVILTALDGLGGIGKTQLALEFVWQHYKDCKGVAWFDAESQERLTEDYIRLGLELNIIHQDDKDAIKDRALRVKTWLENSKHSGWLLVYDNAPKYKAIGELIPTKGGKVLVTSRYAKGWPKGNIQVKVFTPEESRSYIQKMLGDKALGTKQVNQLAETLGHLPLALAQACAYIKKNPVSITRYLELYEIRKKKLLSDRTLADQTLPPDSNRAIVYITWDITMKAIRRESLLADRWLTICAYLYSNDIPNFLIKTFSERPENNPNNEIFEEALGTLNSYSMLYVNEQSASTSIHRLVQEVIQLKSEAEERIINFGTVLKVFQESFPRNDQSSADYTIKRQLIPHLEAYLFHLDVLQETATLEQVKDIEENYLEIVLSWLADGYFVLGNWQKQRELLERVLTIEERHYGHDHQSTLATRHNMAGALNKQGKYKEALLAYQEVFDISKRELGPEHPSTLTTRNNMALVLLKQGKYEESLLAFQEGFDIWKRKLGPEHPDTLTTRNNMAGVLFKQGKYEKALLAYQEVFDIWKRELGPEHPSTLTTRHNMAGVLDEQGKYEEALLAYQEVFDIRKRELGPEHPDTLTTRINMAGVLFKQGKYEEALLAFQEVFDISERELRPDHPITRNALQALEAIQAKTGSRPSYGLNDQLFVAVKTCNSQWVIDCIRRRANVDARDYNNWAPLHHAAEKGCVEIVKTLLQNRASINVEKNGKATPLHFAARYGHTKVVKVLLKSGALVNATTRSNWTPLHFAAKENHIGVAKALLRHGAVYDTRDSQDRAPVQLTNNPEIIGVLNIIDKLFNYVRKSNLNELINYLSEGAVINARNSDEKTLLQLVVQQNRLEIALILLECGANVNDLDENQQLIITEFMSSQ